MSDWKPIETAPKDGTHILAILHREACKDMDGIRRKAFSEVREIWWRPYRQFGMDMPWHAGDPFDSHDGMAPDHFGEAVPTHWMPLPPPPQPSREGRMTDTMVNRVARAMEKRRQELIAQPLSRIWPELTRTAIEEMRRPTETVVSEGSHALCGLTRDCDCPGEPEIGTTAPKCFPDFETVWNAAIDAALAEGEGK